MEQEAATIEERFSLDAFKATPMVLQASPVAEEAEPEPSQIGKI